MEFTLWWMTLSSGSRSFARAWMMPEFASAQFSRLRRRSRTFLLMRCPAEINAMGDVSTNSVVIEGLVKRFGNFVAVDQLTLNVRRGEVFGFLGPNGAGKSTTIRMLCGLLKPSAGRAIVVGHDVGREPEAVRQTIGYMSQKFSLYNDLTVIENLRLFAGLYSVPAREVKERIEW